MTKNSANQFGWWIDYLIQSTGKNIHLETSDGVHREGMITGFTFRSMELNGNTVEFPIEVELNKDPSDRIPLERCISLKVF